MHRVASSSYASTSAPVGQASRHSVHAPQLIRLRPPRARSRLTATPARNIQEPISGWIRQVFLPIQPRPACAANDSLLHVMLVDEDRRLERVGVLPRASTPRALRAAPTRTR